MTSAYFLNLCIYIALAMLMLAMVLVSIRVMLGPTLADRILGLDQLVAVAIGFIAVIAIKTGFELYVDIALALGLTGFLATTAFARYLYMNGDASRPGGSDLEERRRDAE